MPVDPKKEIPTVGRSRWSIWIYRSVSFLFWSSIPRKSAESAVWTLITVPVRPTIFNYMMRPEWLNPGGVSVDDSGTNWVTRNTNRGIVEVQNMYTGSVKHHSKEDVIAAVNDGDLTVLSRE